MENYFTVGETAKIVKTTSETLRHYDRIGLVKPSRKEEWTGYRYYSKQDIVRLNTIRALRSMELSLGEIREVLEYDDLQKIVGFLERAERKADEKIAELQYCKAKIQLARKDYEKKRQGRQPVDGPFLQEFPERVILLSHTLEAPTLENLWDYLRHFYDQIDPAERESPKSLDPACGRVPVRGLHRGKQGGCSGRADENGPPGIWGRAGIYRAAHCGFRHFAVELSGAGLFGKSIRRNFL